MTRDDILGFLITIGLVVAVMVLEAYFRRKEERKRGRKK